MRQLRAGRLLLLILSGIAIWCVAPASAQFGELPQPVIESATITPEQTDEIQKYITPRLADIETGEAAKVKRAREELEGPAANPRATIAFRTAYSDALVPALDRLGKNANDVVVINAIQIAGILGTGPAVDLVEKYRADQRAAVRYKAVAGLRDTIQVLGRMAPVIGADGADRLVDNLATGLSTETDADIADMYVRAMLAAATLNQTGFAAIPDKAFGELVRVVGTRVRKLGNAAADRSLLPAFIRAAEQIRDTVAADVVPRSRPEGFARDAGGLGGDLLAYVFRRVRAGDLPAPKDADQAALDQARDGRQVEITITRLGSTMVFSARDRLAVGNVENEPDLAAMIGQAVPAGDRAFQQAVLAIIGDGGLLTKPPFNFNADRFLGGK